MKEFDELKKNMCALELMASSSLSGDYKDTMKVYLSHNHTGSRIGLTFRRDGVYNGNGSHPEKISYLDMTDVERLYAGVLFTYVKNEIDLIRSNGSSTSSPKSPFSSAP